MDAENKLKTNLRFFWIITILFIIALCFLPYLVIKIKSGEDSSWLDFLSSGALFFIPCALIIVLFFIIVRMGRNFKLLKELLGGKQEFRLSSFGLSAQVVGYYKNRRARCQFPFFPNTWKTYYIIKPHRMPQIVAALFNSIRPTDKTMIVRDEIFYLTDPFDWHEYLKIALIQKHSNQDFINIFEELIRAAEIVETRPLESYAKKSISGMQNKK